MNDPLLRDQLAITRTALANERTFLAYVRTALAMAGGGAALLRFLPAHPVLVWLAWALIAAGAAMLLFGLYRFVVVTRRVYKVRQVPSSPPPPAEGLERADGDLNR